MIGYKVTNLNYTSFIAHGKYQITYTPGLIVNALPNTLGIMFFLDRNHAIKFGKRSAFPFLLIELELKPGHYRSAVGIAYASTEDHLNWFYSCYSSPRGLVSPPLGTMVTMSAYVTYNIAEYQPINLGVDHTPYQFVNRTFPTLE